LIANTTTIATNINIRITTQMITHFIIPENQDEPLDDVGSCVDPESVSVADHSSSSGTSVPQVLVDIS